ncbi:prolipoprotein diacylglyceryl transferase [Treponema sp.]|uniref:prolipoprotein diacylglyceryl transferase n=1 Tax=Treponema sp. TaxID=166 RepID=UPI00388DFB97
MLPFIYIFSTPIPMYGLCIAFGILLASFISKLIIKNENKSFDDFIIFAVILFGMGFLGAKFFYIFITFPISEIPQQLLYLITDKEKSSVGFIFYGGIIFGFLGLFIAKRITRKPIMDYLPIFACILPIIHSFGRIGCFCAGCCYGIPYNGFCAVHYHNPISTVQSEIGIFPVQLLEAIILFLLGIFFITIKFKKKSSLNDDIFIIFSYLISYSVLRFFVEFLRGDIERGKYGLFSTSQIISLCIMIVSIIFLLIFKLKKIKNNNQLA